ncbi:MAG: LLM class flavin-dependent oxidoreductase [Acidobacteriota bacterium]
MATEFGQLLPHFGQYANAKNILEGSRRAEELGFDSVWARDHLIFHPHGMEGTNNTFYDPFIVLAAVGGATSKIKLGTGSLIPHRHPLLLASMMNGLLNLVGDRCEWGFGLGNFQHEFDALGMGEWERKELVPEQLEIIRKLWSEPSVSFEGKFYKFEDCGLSPSPPSPQRIWYAGGTPASVRRALRYCEGWMPGRITLPTYKKRVEKMRASAEEQGRPRVLEGCIPITSIDQSREAALEPVNVQGLLANANKQRFWVKPESGTFSEPEDLEGSFMFGTPDDIVREAKKFMEVGIDQLVFDLRFRYDTWFDGIELLGKEVLPKLR